MYSAMSFRAYVIYNVSSEVLGILYLVGGKRVKMEIQ